MTRIVSGGGITSNKYKTSKAGQKVEPVSHKANVAGVAQQGMSAQFRKEPIISGPGYTPAKVGSTGIANAKFNSASQGPGSGRTLYRSGSQSGTPEPRAMPAGRGFDERPNKDRS